MVPAVTHPILPCGYNSWENNGDEIDGAGVNEPIWPELFDTFDSLPTMIMTEAMISAFDGCPDFTVPCENDTLMIRHEPDTLMVRGRR